MKLPFMINPSVNMSLTEQMLQGLKKAIVGGIYKPGERLPGIRELAEASGVSEKVSRQALRRLAEIGWCVSRRGGRSVVADRGKDRRGRVLLFNTEPSLGFHSSRMVGAIHSRLIKADYRLTAISAYDLKKDGASALLAEMLKEHWDLVIELGMRAGARHDIEESGWPFLVLGDGGKCIPSEAESCIGQVELRCGRAVPDFVRACVKKGVGSVVQFLYAEGGFDVTEMLAISHVICETIHIPRCRDPFDLYSRSYEQMVAFLKKSSGGLPDVIVFTDDHLAHGGLLALTEYGIRIPEDIGIVTHANKGSGPFWVKPLTRLEMDPVSQGDDIAKAVLTYFQTGKFPSGLMLGSEWKLGQTF